jgi:putative nucleotidyltransferase with HDIG domain
VTLADRLDRSFPNIARIRDARLRELVAAQWRYVSERNPVHTDIERIPLHPTLPFETYGGLAPHIRAMAALAEALVPVYARDWGIDMRLDDFLAAAYIHDSAKVIEFVEKDGKLVGTPAFDHAVEGAKVAREVGFPEPIAHMVEAHIYIGRRQLPRTREAQLFQFLDPICLPVFPESGKSAVERHLEANGWKVQG